MRARRRTSVHGLVADAGRHPGSGRRRRGRCRNAALRRLRECAGIGALIALARVAHAQDEFEIQVYDTETAPEGEYGLEVHANHHLIHAAPDQSHLTLEPHYGLTDWLELGGYLQGSVDTTGDFEYAGVKLRAKLRAPERYWHGRIGLAINFELSAVPSRFESNVWGSEVRPVADIRAGWFYGSINPIVGTDLAGANAGHPQFEPAAKAGVYVGRTLLGVEGYASSDVDRAFATIDIIAKKWDLDFGIGVDHGGNDHPIAKLIFGVHP